MGEGGILCKCHFIFYSSAWAYKEFLFVRLWDIYIIEQLTIADNFNCDLLDLKLENEIILVS